mmetsp:Transcript_51267/g.160852  ORF Transcript_51267/g.160852 Transcript_51267/m.160852 type:complete len:277 (+) Transcript_51267:346-1176(+)
MRRCNHLTCWLLRTCALRMVLGLSSWPLRWGRRNDAVQLDLTLRCWRRAYGRRRGRLLLPPHHARHRGRIRDLLARSRVLHGGPLRVDLRDDAVRGHHCVAAGAVQLREAVSQAGQDATVEAVAPAADGLVAQERHGLADALAADVGDLACMLPQAMQLPSRAVAQRSCVVLTRRTGSTAACSSADGGEHVFLEHAVQMLQHVGNHQVGCCRGVHDLHLLGRVHRPQGPGEEVVEHAHGHAGALAERDRAPGAPVREEVGERGVAALQVAPVSMLP